MVNGDKAKVASASHKRPGHIHQARKKMFETGSSDRDICKNLQYLQLVANIKNW